MLRAADCAAAVGVSVFMILGPLSRVDGSREKRNATERERRGKYESSEKRNTTK